MTFFGWNLHYIDATEAFFSEDKVYAWCEMVVGSCETIVKSFLHNHASLEGSFYWADSIRPSNKRDLWTQYVCAFCGKRTLRGCTRMGAALTGSQSSETDA